MFEIIAKCPLWLLVDVLFTLSFKKEIKTPLNFANMQEKKTRTFSMLKETTSIF